MILLSMIEGVEYLEWGEFVLLSLVYYRIILELLNFVVVASITVQHFFFRGWKYFSSTHCMEILGARWMDLSS